MSKKMILVLTALIVFSSCAAEPAPLDIPDEPPVTPTEHEITPTPTPTQESYVSISDDGIVEINMTKLLGFNNNKWFWRIKSLDDRHVVVMGDDFYVVDMEEQQIVYTGRIPGNVRSEFREYRDNGVYIYSATEATREPVYTEEYHITYIFPDNSRTESLGGEWISTITDNRILRYFDGGIYEDIDGELIELLPPNEDFDHFDEDGNWRPNFAAVSHGFLEQIDENRFIYNKGGYEWTWGFGVYDFATGRYTDMPDTHSLYFAGFRDNIVFTQFAELSAPFGIFATNIDTLETEYFLSDEDFPRKELPWEEADERYTMPVLESFALSPDKSLIAVTDYDLNVYIICAETGALKETLHVDALYKKEDWYNSIYVDFLGNDRVIVFDQKWHLHDQRALIIPLN